MTPQTEYVSMLFVSHFLRSAPVLQAFSRTAHFADLFYGSSSFSHLTKVVTICKQKTATYHYIILRNDDSVIGNSSWLYYIKRG